MSDVDRRVREGMPVLDRVALRLFRRFGATVPMEDLRALGRQGLVDAAQAYDASRGDFSSFVASKVKWAILDGVRRETHGRTAARVQAIADAERIGEILSTPDEPEDGALPTEDEATRLRRLLDAQAAALALNLVAAVGDMALVADGADTPEDRAMRASLGRRLRGAVSELPVRERTLVERHYFSGEPFDAIAGELGISKSWASRLHAAAMCRLADKLKDDT